MNFFFQLPLQAYFDGEEKFIRMLYNDQVVYLVKIETSSSHSLIIMACLFLHSLFLMP